MSNKEQKSVSAYLTLPPNALFSQGTISWRKHFPFSSPNGLWTFSGRVALFIGLKSLNIKRGSTILVPSYFQGAEIDTLLAAGFTLRFYRLDSHFNLDLDDVYTRLDSDVSSLYVIHYFGFPQPLMPIVEFCKNNHIALIEDCALSLFSRENTTCLGAQGDMALYSVYKSLPLPHGGFLVTKDTAPLATLHIPPPRSTFFQTADLVAQHLKARLPCHSFFEHLWSLTSSTRKKLADSTIVSGSTAWDPRLLNFGISPVVLRLMDQVSPESVIKKRRENFACLHSLLAETKNTLVEKLPEGACPLFYPLRVANRSEFRRKLASHGIGSVSLWSQNHPACPADLTAQAQVWREEIVELPIHQQLNIVDVKRIGRVVQSLLAHQ